MSTKRKSLSVRDWQLLDQVYDVWNLLFVESPAVEALVEDEVELDEHAVPVDDAERFKVIDREILKGDDSGDGCYQIENKVASKIRMR